MFRHVSGRVTYPDLIMRAAGKDAKDKQSCLQPRKPLRGDGLKNGTPLFTALNVYETKCIRNDSEQCEVISIHLRIHTLWCSLAASSFSPVYTIFSAILQWRSNGAQSCIAIPYYYFFNTPLCKL